MKLLFIPGLIILSCGSVKTNQPSVNTDTVKVIIPIEKKINDSSEKKTETTVTLPRCIKNKIDSFKFKAVHEQPGKVVEYMYKGKRVYYIEMPCCDFFNEVYDDKCNFLGSPDGGFTGKGDGKLPDFYKKVTGEKLIWKAVK